MDTISTQLGIYFINYNRKIILVTSFFLWKIINIINNYVLINSYQLLTIFSSAKNLYNSSQLEKVHICSSINSQILNLFSSKTELSIGVDTNTKGIISFFVSTDVVFLVICKFMCLENATKIIYRPTCLETFTKLILRSTCIKNVTKQKLALIIHMVSYWILEG